MNNLLKTNDFAKALGVNSGIITLARKAGHIIPNDEGYYDILHPKTKFWIDGQVSKGKTFDVNRIINAKFAPKEKKITPPIVRKEPGTFIIDRTTSQSGESESGPLNNINETIQQNIIDQKKEVVILKSDNKRGKRKQSNSDSSDSNDIDDNSGLYDAKLKLEIKKLKNQDKLETLKIAKIEGELLPVDAVENIFLWAAENFRKTYEQDVDNMINIFIKKLGGEQKDFIEMKKVAMECLCITGNSLKENLIDGVKNAVSEYSEVRGRGERQ